MPRKWATRNEGVPGSIPGVGSKTASKLVAESLVDVRGDLILVAVTHRLPRQTMTWGARRIGRLTLTSLAPPSNVRGLTCRMPNPNSAYGSTWVTVFM
jgi:hypothetical protein